MTITATEIFEQIKQQPQVAPVMARQHLDTLLAEKAIHLTITVGEQVCIKHAWFAVVRVDYPYIILEFVSVAQGYEHQDEKLTVGHRLVWKSAHMQVVQIAGVYVGLEITGITDRLEKRIARSKAAKQLAGAGKTPTHGIKRGKRRKARNR